MKSCIWLWIICSSLIFARSDALVVGVGVYKNSIKPLYGIPYDMKNIKQILSYLEVEKDKTIVLQDANATLKNLRAYFEHYITSKDNRDENSFYFYYTGHGLQVEDKSGDESNHKDEASALYDMSYKHGMITGGILLDDELYAILSKIKSKKILIFDKCHGDSSYRSPVTGYAKMISKKFKLSKDFASTIEQIPKAEEGLQNYISLSASKDDEVAEDSPLGGLFTQSLLQGLVYQKVKNYKSMTLQDLQDFCSENITILAKYYRENSKGAYDLGGAFTPQFRPYKILNTSLRNILDIQKATKPNEPKKYLLEDMLDSLVTYNTIKPRLSDAKRLYKLNHRVSFTLKSRVAGYLTIFIAYQDSYTLFMENKKIKRDKNYIFPNDFSPKDSSIEISLRATEPLGVTKVYTILSKKPLELASHIEKIKSNDLALVHSFSKELMPSIEYEAMQKKQIRPIQKVREKKPNIKAISKVEFIVVK